MTAYWFLFSSLQILAPSYGVRFTDLVIYVHFNVLLKLYVIYSFIANGAARVKHWVKSTVRTQIRNY